MSQAKVIFSLDGDDLTIDCSNDDKMGDICQEYSTKIDKNIDSLLFSYENNQVNFDLCFKDQINSLDKNNNEMKIIVDENIKSNETDNNFAY